MLSPRFLAADGPQVTASQEDPEMMQAPFSSTGYEIASQNTQQSLDFVRQSNEQNAKLMAESNEALAQFQQNAGQLRAAVEAGTRGGDNSGFGNLIQGLGGLAELWQQIQEAERKRRNAQAWVAVNAEAEPFISRSEDIINSEVGYPGWESRAARLIGQYSNDLDPEQIVEINRRLYDAAQPVLTRQAQALRDFNDRNNENRRAVESSVILTELSGLLTQVRTPTTPEAQVDAMLTFQAALTQRLQGRPVEDQLYISRQLQTELAEAAETGSVAAVTAQRELQNFDQFLLAQQSAQQEFSQTGSLELYRFQVLNAAQEFDIDLSFTRELLDPTVQRDFEYETQQRQNAVRALQQDSANEALAGIDFDEATVTAIAYALYAQPASRAQYENLRNIPDVEAAFQIADARTKYDEMSFALQRRTAEVNVQISNLNNQNRSASLQYLLDDRSQSSIDQLLGANALLGQGLRTYREQLRIAADNAIGRGVAPENDPQVIATLEAMQGERASIAQSLTQSLQTESEELSLYARRWLLPYGLTTSRESEIASGASARLQAASQTIQTAQQEAARRVTPQVVNPTSPQFATVRVGDREAIVPFRPGTNVPQTSPYGQVRTRRNGRGTYQHDGVDYGLPEGTPIISYVNGRVQLRNDPEGYGTYVDIVDAEGYRHRFAHLSRANVRDGQTINVGQVIGAVGSTGRSTGPHLHWMIKRPGAPEFGFEGTMNPTEFTAGLQNGLGRQVRNGQSQPTQVPLESARLRGGGFISRDVLYDNSGRAVGTPQYTAANPIRNDYASPRRQDYPRSNPADANYGYTVLRDDRAFRIELARVANRLNFPAQWLADLIAFESGFDPAKRNVGGSGATGLIQFMPETARNMGTSTAELARMSRTQQLRYVERYLRERLPIQDPFELLLAVWSTPRNQQRYRENPQSVRRVSDGDITFSEYAARLGSHAGRQYELPWAAAATRVHTGFTQGCAMCQSLQRSGSRIYPHESN